MNNSSKRTDVMQEAKISDDEFLVTLDDGRIARCWIAAHQEYKDCVFSAGLVNGLGVDEYYFRVEGHGEPLTLFLRRDEAQAMVHILSGALWSGEILERYEQQREGNNG